MRKVLHIALLTAAAVMLCSCDFFRTLAGRPTSDEIAAKAVHIEKIEAAKAEAAKARLDSIARAQKILSDSLAVMDSLHAGRFMLAPSKNVRASSLASLDSRYYVILGSFGDRANAEKQARNVEAAGWKPVLIDLTYGFTMVAAAPGNRIASAYGALTELRRHRFCPRDAWIMEVER